jgi:hypothetical protein
MSEHFLKFKKAFHQSMPQMPQMKFSIFPKQMFGKLNDFDRIKWIQLFSSGVIIYSAYYYLKRTPKYNEDRLSFSSFFYHFKKLFSRTVANGCRREKEPQKNIELKVKELPEHVKYDNGWFDELDELKKSLTLTSASTSALGDDALLDPLRETTPRGEIVMYYDTKTKSFNYYSNSKNIPYSTLDAVARKYVCLHKDPSIYIDIRDEVQKGIEKRLKKDKDNKLKLERSKNNKDNNNTNGGMISSAKKSLFAAFKNYKTGRNAPKSLHNYDGKVTVEEFVVIKDNVNKFIYKGTIEQYDVDVKYYNNKQQSHFRTVHDDASDASDASDAGNAGDDDKNVHDNDIYHELKHEKEALSYTDFKKKYNQ